MNWFSPASAAIPYLSRRRFLQYGAIFVGSSVISACTKQNQATTSSSGLDKVTFGTNWLAQAEHGGFYQAIATGIYKQHGLDVTIKMGGPQVPSGAQLLTGGVVDFFMGNGIDAFNAVAQAIPTISVAAIFQKDPQCIIVHPNTGVKTLADLKGRPMYISAGANVTFWPLLKAKFGFTDDQKRPYNFNPAPFLTDKTSAQQGYITSEPFAIEKQGGFKPQVFLIADYGYPNYTTTIETTKEIVKNKPDLVQRFVDASIKGWYSYLENPQPGNQLIKQDNPEMTDAQLAYGLQKLQEYGIIISGTAQQQGIGSMTEEKWRSLFESMVSVGLYQPNLKYQDGFTLQFINKGVEYYQKS
ncbi:nitrate ABC transporter substrate-binding protein [Nostoc sp. CENA543]|uniref:ABC transporter substrate-binding protein n=1 Tax=Nostoc sp. CENA543 TaxID=1869241 RepID=UPI000CA233A5|nr:ABC transporter substrate-binding protein [Nostoc sp. CENA543]AUT03928.1 nitrate ABC transporter substrate-binding protein [Nostoc sp. CENA543]